jgi:hypothetical protein
LRAKFASFIQSHWGFILVVYGFAGAYWVAIDWRVNQIVKDDEFIEKIARRGRPAMVFNQGSRIISDSGALALLEVMPIFGVTSNNDLQITVKPKKWMASEPIIESLDMGAVSVTTERGIANTWNVFIAQRYLPVTGEGTPTNPAPLRFRLELTPTR